MYLFWNFDISQESSAYPNFRELPRKKPKIHLGGHWKMHRDPLQVREHPIRSGPPSLQQEALWFRSPSLVQACSGQLHQSKGGEKRAFCCDLWCSGENELGKICENLSYIIIHTVAFACFYHIYVYNLYMYISYHSAHNFQYAQDLSIMVLRRSSERTYLPSCSINLGSMPWLQQLGGDHDLQNVMSLVV